MFGKRSIEYLGHVISSGGVAMDPSKIQCVKDCLIPQYVKGVREFLGLIGFYRRFIKDYDQIAKPLTESTKKEGLSGMLELNKPSKN